MFRISRKRLIEGTVVTVLLCCFGWTDFCYGQKVRELPHIDLGRLIVAQQATQGVTIPDDHPRLAEFIRRGLVKKAPPRNWGSEQATGEPNTQGAGDITTAWASSTQDGQIEWLELTYDQAVKPVEVHVVETYNPGALFKVTASTSSGMEVVLWKGKDPTPPDAAERRGTSKVKVTAAIKTNRIRIHLASDKVPGWNEIDAVGIKDDAGKMHWAKSATASTEYAGGIKPGWVLDNTAALKVIGEMAEEIDALKKRIAELEAAGE
mgnify:CR=1 FL=1